MDFDIFILELCMIYLYAFPLGFLIRNSDTFISRLCIIHLYTFPLGFLIGDGFSTWSENGRGGDFGHAETLHQLGLPFYIAVIIGLFKLIKLSLYKIQILNLKIHEDGSYLYFAVCVLLYILITTLHYSTWSAKSILPIFFISIAIISRYFTFQTNQYSNK